MAAITCRDSSERIAPGTDYELTAYDGHSLPAETFAIVEMGEGGRSVQCANRLVRMGLLFDSSGRFTRTEASVVACDDGRAEVIRSQTAKGTYKSSRGGVILSLPGEFGVTQSLGKLKGETLAVSSAWPKDSAFDSSRAHFPLTFVTRR